MLHEIFFHVSLVEVVKKKKINCFLSFSLPVISFFPTINIWFAKVISDFLEFRKYFNMFDKENKGYIRATQVGQILRTMGQAFEERDLKQLIKEFDSDGKCTLFGYLNCLSTIQLDYLSKTKIMLIVDKTEMTLMYPIIFYCCIMLQRTTKKFLLKIKTSIF